jgi:hypothetical protein
MMLTEKMQMLLAPKIKEIGARLMVSREDGITIYDSIQDSSTNSVAALVSGVWQASEALMNLVQNGEEILNFRLSFGTSDQGIYLLPFSLHGKRYFLGAIYHDCLNPGLLKRKLALLKEEIKPLFESVSVEDRPGKATRHGYLFEDLSDEEIDRLFSMGGI